MTSLIRWEPFRDLFRMQNEMNRFLASTLRVMQSWESDGAGWDNMTWTPATDVWETDDQFIVEAVLPGVSPENVDIRLANNVLTIQGEIQPVDQEGHFHLRERQYGKFCRSLQLPVPVNSDQIEANYYNGVLTLRLPKEEAAKPKRIAVRSNGHKVIADQVIEAQPA